MLFYCYKTNEEISKQKINCKKYYFQLELWEIVHTMYINNVFFYFSIYLIFHFSVMEEVKKEQIDIEDPLKLPLEKHMKKEIFEPSTG